MCEICKKCCNKQNMRQSHIRIKLACLAVDILTVIRKRQHVAMRALATVSVAAMSAGRCADNAVRGTGGVRRYNRHSVLRGVPSNVVVKRPHTSTLPRLLRPLPAPARRARTSAGNDVIVLASRRRKDPRIAEFAIRL